MAVNLYRGLGQKLCVCVFWEQDSVKETKPEAAVETPVNDVRSLACYILNPS